MKFTTQTNKYCTIFVVILFSCFVFANAAEAEVDPRFDSGSASLARTWQNIKGSLPHEKIPDNADDIKDVGSWGKDYGISIAKIVGLGFAIALLSIVAGILYGIIKLIRLLCCCCCGKKKKKSDSDDEYEDEEEEEDTYTWNQKWIPTFAYMCFFVFLLTGMIIGLLNNPRFSEGVNDMGDSVIKVGSSAVNLGSNLSSAVDDIVAMVPTTIDGIEYEFSGVLPLSDDVNLLASDVNSTSIQVSNITNSIAAIDANITSVASLYQDLSNINNSSQKIISQMSDLTYQIATKLRTTFNDTIGSLDEKVAEINETVDGLTETADNIIEQANDLVDKVINFVNDGKSYDNSRQKAVLALFVVVIVVFLAIILGYILKIKCIFNIIAALGFVFLFLLWLSGSIHFLLGMVLYDTCPVIDVAVRGMLPQDSDAADVLEGCLYEHRTVLDSMNITAYNLTAVFDYKEEFLSFANFSETFNFTTIDEYFTNIEGLYSYNLTAVAANLTVATFGWNESYVYSALDALNNQTYPLYYGLNNYTLVNSSAYPYPKNDSVEETKEILEGTIIANTTIYNKTEVAKRQLIEAQNDIDQLLANMEQLHARFNDTKNQINTLQTKNISACIQILDNLQGNITGFFDLGNCSFLGDAYNEIRTSLCATMQPAIDTLTVAQFLAGLALIPLVILAEVLSYRIPKSKMNLCEDDEEYYDEEKGDKKWNREQARRGENPMSATISTSPPSTDSATSSPDFSARRRTIEDHFASRE